MSRERRGPRWGKEGGWRAFAEEIQGDFLEETDDHGHTVRTTMGDWIVTMDIYAHEGAGAGLPATRIRAPFAAREGLRFRVYRGNWLHEIGKLFGLQDIEVGHPYFDKDFIIQGAPVQDVQKLIGDRVLMDLIRRQPQFDLAIQDTEGWLGPAFPEGVDVLRFAVPGVIQDPYHLHGLFELYERILDRVSYRGPYDPNDPRIQVQRLRVPGREIRSKGLLHYDGRSIQLDAARRLGDIGDAESVPALIHALRSGSPALRARAANALGQIGDPRAIDPLIEALSLGGTVEGRPVGDWARQGLHALRFGELALVVRKALLNGSSVEQLLEVEERRAAIIAAFIEALRGSTAVNAAGALVELGAVEALPAMWDRLRVVGKKTGPGIAIESAIQALQQRASLPRPANAPRSRHDTLPKAAGAPPPDTTDLPRVAGSHAPPDSKDLPRTVDGDATSNGTAEAD